jgi:hypothetical protein
MHVSKTHPVRGAAQSSCRSRSLACSSTASSQPSSLSCLSSNNSFLAPRRKMAALNTRRSDMFHQWSQSDATARPKPSIGRNRGASREHASGVLRIRLQAALDAPFISLFVLLSQSCAVFYRKSHFGLFFQSPRPTLSHERYRLEETGPVIGFEGLPP